jgi:excisionase family DNA binding protein
MENKSNKVPSGDSESTPAESPAVSPTPPKGLMTVEEAAERLRVDPKTVYRLINMGELKAILIGRVYRVEEEDLDEFKQQAKLKTQRLPKKKY